MAREYNYWDELTSPFVEMFPYVEREREREMDGHLRHKVKKQIIKANWLFTRDKKKTILNFKSSTLTQKEEESSYSSINCHI